VVKDKTQKLREAFKDYLVFCFFALLLSISSFVGLNSLVKGLVLHQEALWKRGLELQIAFPEESFFFESRKWLSELSFLDFDGVVLIELLG